MIFLGNLCLIVCIQNEYYLQPEYSGWSERRGSAEDQQCELAQTKVHCGNEHHEQQHEDERRERPPEQLLAGGGHDLAQFVDDLLKEQADAQYSG